MHKNEYVDLTNKPTADSTLKENLGVTIGDLHANAVKLLFFLVKEGVVELTTEQYNSFVTFYNQSDLIPPASDALPPEVLAEQLLKMKHIINGLMVKNKDVLVRLIGDELADRGKNDWFILLLLDKLHQEQIDIELLISNHGVEFIKAYEKKGRFKSDAIGHHAQSISMDNMQKYIDLGLLSREEIEFMVNRAYLPKLKLISYSLETDHSGIRIYSHAPIDLVAIKNIASRLGVEYNDVTVRNLAQTIDAINSEFQKNYVATGRVNELFNSIHDENDPFTFLIWNRNYSQLNRNPKHNNYSVHYVHGHDSGKKSSLNISNLDNQLGKPGNARGLYDVMHTYGLTLPEIKKMDYSRDLIVLERKCQQLKKKAAKNVTYKSAYDHASSLHRVLIENWEKLNEHKISYDLFQTISLDALDKAKPVLAQHRGWKPLLLNIALGVVGLGLFYIFAGLINLGMNGHFLFAPKTDSLKIIEKLEQDFPNNSFPV